MDLTSVLSIVALVVSVISLAFTAWSTRISRKSLDHSIEIQKANEAKEFERVRGQLLIQIADDRRLLDKARIEIGTLKAYFDAEPENVRLLLTNFTDLFTRYLPSIEASIRQADALWQDVSSWSQEKSHKGLTDAQATLYRCLKDDELVYDSACFQVNVFREKLNLARERVGRQS